MDVTLDRACVDVKNLPDNDLVELLCATESEIETHGEFNELKELLLDCAAELLKRPALLRLEIKQGRSAS